MRAKNGHFDYSDVRRRLEGSLKSKFKEATWKRMLESGMVRDFVDGNEDWEDLRGYADEAMNYQRELAQELLPELEEAEKEAAGLGYAGGGEAGSRCQATFTIELPRREQKRASVLLEIQMRQAASQPDVERFRNERLGGRLLCAEEAETYCSPGVRRTTDEELAELGQRLGRYYGWNENDAAWFVLTGEAPTLHPLAASFFMNKSIYGPSYCELTLRVAPWVPAEEVKRTFLRMREQVRDGSGPGTVGEQRLEVLRFVEEERAKLGQWPGSEILLQTWNQEHPHWSYPDYRSFLKAYREAHREVLYPEYHTPRRQRTPNMERQEARDRKFVEELRKNR